MGLSLHSTFHVFPSRMGRKIAAYLDYADEFDPSRPFVLLTPRYGETKKNNLHLGYLLAANGLNAFRFDHTFHIGESEGDILHYTFTSGCGDILDALDYLAGQFHSREVILLASSLSVRPALRAARLDARIARLVSLAGVVNFRATAREVYQDDMVGHHLAGRPIGVTDILGHQVHVAHFLEDCIAQNMHDLLGTLDDLRQASSDCFFFCARNDAWVSPADVEALARAREDFHLSWIPEALHELRENPRISDLVLRSAAFVCLHGRFPQEGETGALLLPDRALLLAQNKRERERLQRAHPATRESSFWGEYLGKYSVLEHIPAFQDYLQLAADCLGPLRPGQCLLDLGCGNGLFGAWCQRQLRLDPPPPDAPRPVYFGLDLTPGGLAEALLRHQIPPPLPAPPSGEPPLLDCCYLPFDLEILGRSAGSQRVQLPFADGTFDQICCSLLLSYLRRPESVLAECYRVLRPGGGIIVSSMKPWCDLSLLYRDYVTDHRDPQILQSARNLLSAAGAIRLKEEQGHYRFFHREELTSLMSAAGFHHLRCFRTFGDQANLAAARR